MLRRLPSALIAVAFVAFAFAPTRGAAQEQAYELLTGSTGVNTGDVVFGCRFAFQCSTNTECEGDVCAELDPNTQLKVCAPETPSPSIQAFCCETVEDCPVYFGQSAAACVTVSADLQVCRYPDSEPTITNFCAGFDTISLEDVSACFTSVEDLGLVGLSVGDCDRDGVANASDDSPCDHIAIDLDGGIIDFFDTGVAPLDSGTSGTGGGVGFNGGGGCAVAPSAPAPLMFVAFALFGLFARRRRS